MNRVKALSILGFDFGFHPPSRSEIRKAFRRAALKCHPDKGGSPEEFFELERALSFLEKNTVLCEGKGERDQVSSKESYEEPRKKDFDPRAFSGAVDLSSSFDWTTPLFVVWRCKLCPPKSSVCCRVKPRKHKCLCGHKLEDHKQGNKFACSKCDCAKFEFHVQLNGWSTRCRCKHKPTDHAVTGRRACLKCVGKYAKQCDCAAYTCSWVCNCDHAWSDHETVFVTQTYSSLSRAWVCSGVSKAVAEEAEWKREAASRRIATKLDEVRSRGDGGTLDDTDRFIRQTIRELGLSDAALDRVRKEVSDRESGVAVVDTAVEKSKTEVDSEREDIRSKLKLIYRAYAPGNLEKIPRLLESYRGKEKRLLRKVMKKYGCSSMATVEASLRRKEGKSKAHGVVRGHHGK